MQSSSSSSVRVYWLDRNEAVRRVRQAVEALKRQHTEIERVILFGSLVRGDAVPGSDADIMIVLSESTLPWRDRRVRYTPENVGMDMDVFAYTQAELEDLLRSGNSFVSSALRDGMEL